MPSPSRSALSAIPGSREARLLPPTVIPGNGGYLVVQVLPLSVRFSVYEDRNSPPISSVEIAIPQFSLLVEDADTAILAARLGLLQSPAGVQ